MSKNPIKDLNRRNFLRAGSVSLASSLLLHNALQQCQAKDIETAWLSRSSAPPDDEPAVENISVGYWSKSEIKDNEPLRLQSLPTLRRDADVLRLQRGPEGLSVRGVKSINKDDIPSGAAFKPDVVAADNLSSGEPRFAEKGVKVLLHGMFANGRQWSDGDRGSFQMKLVFKPYENCCDKISSASIGALFVARKNDLVAEISSGFVAFDGAPIDKDAGLKMSFDLVDVYDPRDRGLVLTILDTVAKLSSLEGILGTAGVAAPYIAAGSAILDALGIHLLSDPQQNTQLWSNKNFVQFFLGNTPNTRKLKRGTYFIGGQPKAGGLPAWGTYELRASDPGNTGEKLYLFKDNPEKNRLDPVDFTYVMISVDYASKLP